MSERIDSKTWHAMRDAEIQKKLVPAARPPRIERPDLSVRFPTVATPGRNGTHR